VIFPDAVTGEQCFVGTRFPSDQQAQEAIMGNRLPPIPAANRSKKGPQNQPQSADDDIEAKVTGHDERLQNQEQQGRHANLTQNTKNQGLQQDR